ncbi:hypothetical protein FRC19_003642 [Serendipita sp. 401]|nr:hypothetical protein FRC19_003642 [Serendipita sp. 401]
MAAAQQAQNLPLPLRHAIQELGVAVANITRCKYTSVAGLTVVMYDILLLMSDGWYHSLSSCQIQPVGYIRYQSIWLKTRFTETRLIWQRPKMAPSRIAYFVNRYVPPIFLLVANYQLGGFRGPLTNELAIAPLVQLFTCTCATYILVLRVLALYRAGRAFTIAIYVLFAISYGACLGITINASIVIKKDAFFDPLVHICNIKNTPRIFRFIFLTPIFFEILIGGLTLWKCIQHAYVISHASSAPMIYIMLRDGLIWWTLVVGLRVWNALIWVFLPQSLVYLGIYVHWALVSASVSRFFLNILDVGTQGTIDGFSTAYVTVREQEVDAARKGMLMFGANSVLEIGPQTSPRDEYECDEFYTEMDRYASALSRRGKTRSRSEVA